MKKTIKLLLISFVLILGLSACTSNIEEAKVTNKEENQMGTFEEIVEKAKGSKVTFYGWGGSDLTNNYIDHFIAPIMKDKYDIEVNRVGMDIDEILNNLTNSVAAKEEEGPIDVIWINGENFFTAKKNNLLYGPFVDKLPNFEKYLDKDSDEVKYDFGYETQGYEAPFGKAELVMEYDSNILDKIDSADALLEAAKNNPGKITYPALPDFTGSAFVRNIIYEKVGYDKVKDLDPNDEEKVRETIKPALDYLKELKPYLWKEGKTYPKDSVQLENMFQDGSVIFNVSYNPNHASTMIEKGAYKDNVKTCVFNNGDIGNTHFLAIAKNSSKKEGAIVLINEIMSFESQLEKYKPSVWGDLPVFEIDKLTEDEKEKLKEVKIGPATLTEEELLKHRVPELKADMVPLIEKIWNEEIPG